jgi:excinuclease ABC subunit A
MQDKIVIRGAREHNLKNIDLELPRDQLIVITGLSGSGKSSLAFDTIYAEGQRRYVESLSSYARQFLGLMEKPDVERIDGLSPAISIDQKSSTRNPRSTVGTVTEIYDYLRLLFARIGVPHCPNCGQEVSRQTPQQIADRIKKLPSGTKLLILAPQIRDQKGEHRDVFERIKSGGFVRARVDGEVVDISEKVPRLEKKRKHTIDIVVDRLVAGEELGNRLQDSIETALRLSDGILVVHNLKAKADTLYSEHLACLECGISFPELAPRNFSFNSPHGACPTCTGLGTRLIVEPELIVPNGRLSIAEGAIRPWSRTTARMTWYQRVLEAVAAKHGFSLDVPFSELSDEAKQIIYYGTGDTELRVRPSRLSTREFRTTFEGVVPHLERRYRETDSDFVRKEIERYMKNRTCPTCEGKRLKPEVLAVTIAGASIYDVTHRSVTDSAIFFRSLKLSSRDQEIAHQILKEIGERLTFLVDVGLGYLTLDRSANTLSGGEAQRIRLATQIGSALMGVLYILDEPSIGLHQKDNSKLIATLKRLRELGNTVIVVEHDEETIRAADYLVDIGPGAGEHGGQVVAVGTPAEVIANPASVTGQYLRGVKRVPMPTERRGDNPEKSLTIRGARANNLKDVDVRIPLSRFVTVTGVSGSGKSSLINEILAKALSQHFYKSLDDPAEHDLIEGKEHLDKVIDIDQSPIGRTPRSNPATYTGVFTDIRDLFAALPEAKLRGYGPGRFSFNVKGGRCEVCQGDGVIKIEMHFLPDIYVTCEECKGRRYNREALEILFKDKSIADVLEMTVEEALHFFENIPAIRRKLSTLFDVGLGYIHLGQPATTLSGGEAQRVKLASELSRRSTGKTLYILDEPTTGLHFDDVSKLIEVLEKLVEVGNTVLVIEHNLDVIKYADWIIDLGPEGGEKGGRLIAEGTPETVAQIKASATGEYLKKVLPKRRKSPTTV